MIKLVTTTIDGVVFPQLNLQKGDWISLALPTASHRLLPAYCKRVESQQNSGIFDRKKLFKWLNLTHTNAVFSSQKTLLQFIEKQKNIDPSFLKNYVEEELELDLNQRMKYLDGTKRVAFLYELEKTKADLITISLAGVEPWGVRKIRAVLQRDQSSNRVIEFCQPVSRRYNVARESTLIKLSKG